MNELSEWAADVERDAVEQSKRPGGRPAKGYRGRQRKLECQSCGFIAYASAGAVERAGGLPACACGQRMIVPNFRDRIVIDPGAVELEIYAAPADVARELRAEARRLGWEIAPPVPRERKSCSVGSQPRCKWEGGYCSRFAAWGGYCDEHGAGAR